MCHSILQTLRRLYVPVKALMWKCLSDRFGQFKDTPLSSQTSASLPPHRVETTHHFSLTAQKLLPGFHFPGDDDKRATVLDY